jgi:hypothetical protein
MKMKKLSEDHYIIVDDSDIKIGDIVAERLLIGDYGFFTIHTLNDIDKTTQKVITHSTQPLENINFVDEAEGKIIPKIKPLSLSEVKELLGVVDVEKRGEKKYPKSEFWVGSGPSRLYDENAKERRTYIEGYNQALEDNKEKKYTEEDMRKAYYQGHKSGLGSDNGLTFEHTIQSLQPKTEWEVEFVDGKLKLKS